MLRVRENASDIARNRAERHSTTHDIILLSTAITEHQTSEFIIRVQTDLVRRHRSRYGVCIIFYNGPAERRSSRIVINMIIIIVIISIVVK